MSTLVLVLTAAMAVPGNGPEMVSADMEPPGLDLSGEWEGTLQAGHKEAWVRLDGRKFVATDKKNGKAGAFWVKTEWESFDEGRGKIRMKIGGRRLLGIYEQAGDRLAICYRVESRGHPTSFHPNDDQYLLILHRVKPRK